MQQLFFLAVSKILLVLFAGVPWLASEVSTACQTFGFGAERSGLGVETDPGTAAEARDASLRCGACMWMGSQRCIHFLSALRHRVSAGSDVMLLLALKEATTGGM